MNQDYYQPTASNSSAKRFAKIAWILVAIVLAVVIGVAIGAGQDKAPVSSNNSSIASETPGPTPDARTAQTSAIFYTTWGRHTDAQRTILCSELLRDGKKKTVEALKAGANNNTTLDWSLTADLLAAECSKR